MKKVYLIAVFSFSFLIFISTKGFSQYTTPVSEIESIKEAIKIEDFNSLSILLKNNHFSISKSNLNYNRGNQYIIAEIECERLIPTINLKNKYGTENNFERLSILYTDDPDYKRLNISLSYYALRNDFLAYYYKWKSKNWTYVAMSKPNSLLKNDGNKITINKEGDFKIGNIGSLGTLGNDLEKVQNESIRMIEYGDWAEKKPGYKKINFVNFNENLGVLCDYQCELSNPLSSPEYSLAKGDTAYRFTVKMMEFYPKFLSKKINQASTINKIPLIKSGKTYFINVLIGDKKLKYILDSGASDVTIDKLTYDILVENEIINSTHRLPDGKYQIADGSFKIYKRTYIPEIYIGNILFENIVANIVPNGQPLLLGKSLLDNLKSWKIDNLNNVLIVEVQ